jgi:small-conductance mechanosensitive channel
VFIVSLQTVPRGGHELRPVKRAYSGVVEDINLRHTVIVTTENPPCHHAQQQDQ